MAKQKLLSWKRDHLYNNKVLSYYIFYGPHI